jgi:effector-binding domain-containing protein
MSNYEIRVETLPATPTLYKRFHAAHDQIGARLGEVLPAVYGYAMQGSGAPAGAPYTRYLEMTGDGFELEAGLPLAAPGKGQGDIQAGELPAGPAAVTWHVGPYEGLGAAHHALTEWASKNHRTPAGPSWECYVTDPGAEPDPQKWRTQVFLPLRA